MEDTVKQKKRWFRTAIWFAFIAAVFIGIIITVRFSNIPSTIKADTGKAVLGLSNNPSIKTDSEDAKTYCSQGLVHYYTGDYATAINYYNKSIEADPELAESYLYRGNCYGFNGQHELAILD
ncbi:unnamed protein product, partial [marine sediment metagenome]